MRLISFISLVLMLTVSSASMAAPNNKPGTRGKKVDTESPVIIVPGNITAEAVSSAGATVTFNVSATDNNRKGLTTNCTPASGNVFPLAQTTVQCIARDGAGNETADSFIVSVVDTTKPVLSLPSNITESATSDSGDSIAFAVSANDNIDGSVAVVCSSASGSQFSIGQTSVSCSAADSHGNDASGTFSITLVLTEVDTVAPVLSLPANIKAEAVSSSGAPVSFSVSASDEVDGVVSVNCSQNSGETFPLDTTTVSCNAKDTKGNTSNGSFTVSVTDSMSPQLALPADITADAESDEGGVVNFSVSASDSVDGAVAVNCSATSGSLFAIGQTTVTCDTVDNNGNTASGTFNITMAQFAVADTTAPVLSLPDDVTAEATAASGASVNYTASATDEVDGAVAPVCSSTSGSTFAIGQTSVTCNASDSQGNTSTGSFTVSVVDTTVPQLALPADLSVDATESTGIVVDYLASAVDSVDQSVDVDCTPLSGSVFAVGDSSVSCQATDSNGNVASGDFLVSVNAPVATSVSVNLTWSVPTSRENGDPLAVSELAGYEIYVVAEASGKDQVLSVSDPLATSRTISDLVNDTYYFSISTIDTDGLRSAPSDLISTIIQ